jgi:hypothetical protein
LLTFFRQNSDPEEDNLLKRGPRRNYLVDFGRVRFLSRTPGPPPFSSMNSTPAASNARRIARSLAAEPEQSAALREKLLTKLGTITSADLAAIWAQETLAAKNSLAAGDAKLVEDAIRARTARNRWSRRRRCSKHSC